MKLGNQPRREIKAMPSTSAAVAMAKAATRLQAIIRVNRLPIAGVLIADRLHHDFPVVEVTLQPASEHGHRGMRTKVLPQPRALDLPGPVDTGPAIDRCDGVPRPTSAFPRSGMNFSATTIGIVRPGSAMPPIHWIAAVNVAPASMAAF